MNYKELYKESNEQASERFTLVFGRVEEIVGTQEVATEYAGFFKQASELLMLLGDLCDCAENGTLELRSVSECERTNELLYGELLDRERYEKSYANPVYAVEQFGEKTGQALTLLLAHIRQTIGAAFRGDKLRVTAAAELFVEIYNHFEETLRGEIPEEKEIEQDIYWYFHDYCEIFEEEAVRRLICPDESFETEIVMNSDLSDLRYLYRYGSFIGENERKTAEFLNMCSEEKIQAMADTFTEGYRIGFEVTGKNLTKKQTVQIRYPIGFERMVRAAVRNFEKMDLKPTMYAGSTSPNKQFDYDHREDRAFYLDKAYVERCLEVRRTYFEENAKTAAGHAGPAVIEVFGEEPFAPENNKEAIHYSDKQQQICVYERNMRGQQTNYYIKGEERSFTIIAYPIPAIGEKFCEIFEKTVEINTLDYKHYQKMQQKMIDVLDTAEQVHITGKGNNRTDLYVRIRELSNPQEETAFENCVADVNIPVGEVFTSPVLEGTQGKLFVSQVYLNELRYENLELDFRDGMVADYTCTNFADEAENKKYIRDNVLMHHETLPMGEFAIGTNTTAYRMARDYDIADKLPILIAEKTGPHFAVGDTCYSHEEDNVSFNPDGKAVVARDNAISALRTQNPDKAYFNCHTDITIPYDELDRITVIRKDKSTVDLIADGRFVLEGTEELNRPLDIKI